MRKTGFIIVILAIVRSTVCFAAQPTLEYQIKAVFMHKFLMFAEWPAAPSDKPETSVTIGILGEAPFPGDAFRPVEGRIVNGRMLAVKRFEEGTPLEMLRKCRILFISASLKSQMEEILASLKDHPVLTVSQMKGFAQLGGMVNFITKKGRVGFEINKAAAERVGIKFRSKLLRVAARIVED